MDNLTDLIAACRKLGFKPEADHSPIGWPALWVPGMTMQQRHELDAQFPDTISGGGSFVSGPAGQHIEVGDCSMAAVRKAVQA
jgi:hypothetical protein